MPEYFTGRRYRYNTAKCQNPECGKTFQTSRRDAKTCSSTCRSAMSRADQKHKDTRQHIYTELCKFVAGDYGPVTADDIAWLKGIEGTARVAILEHQEQQKLPLG